MAIFSPEGNDILMPTAGELDGVGGTLLLCSSARREYIACGCINFGLSSWSLPIGLMLTAIALEGGGPMTVLIDDEHDEVVEEKLESRLLVPLASRPLVPLVFRVVLAFDDPLPV